MGATHAEGIQGILGQAWEKTYQLGDIKKKYLTKTRKQNAIILMKTCAELILAKNSQKLFVVRGFSYRFVVLQETRIQGSKCKF